MNHPDKYRYTIVNIKTGKEISPEEPVFILRAQDVLASRAVTFYARDLEASGVSPDTIKHILEHADEMSKWPIKKMPD